MSELLHKLGIDWKLLAAQAVNFLVILIVLRLTLYKPIVRMLNERRDKIKKGLDDAERAGKRLDEVEGEVKSKIAKAEKESLAILSKLEEHAKEKETEILKEAKRKENEILKNAEKMVRAHEQETEKKFYEEAVGIVKSAVAKVAEISPSEIDESLVKEAVRAVKELS